MTSGYVLQELLNEPKQNGERLTLVLMRLGLVVYIPMKCQGAGIAVTVSVSALNQKTNTSC